MTNLDPGLVYYLAISAIGTNGMESELSSELSFRIADHPGTNVLRITPIASEQVDGVEWREVEMRPTYVKTTNKSSIFYIKSLKIQK